jgi:hypothetical protein
MKKVCAYVGENNSSVAFVWDVDGFAAFRSGGVWNTAAGLEMADLPDGYAEFCSSKAARVIPPGSLAISGNGSGLTFPV